jgi:hypothetical protein
VLLCTHLLIMDSVLSSFGNTCSLCLSIIHQRWTWRLSYTLRYNLNMNSHNN